MWIHPERSAKFMESTRYPISLFAIIVMLSSLCLASVLFLLAGFGFMTYGSESLWEFTRFFIVIFLAGILAPIVLAYLVHCRKPRSLHALISYLVVILFYSLWHFGSHIMDVKQHNGSIDLFAISFVDLSIYIVGSLAPFVILVISTFSKQLAAYLNRK